MKQNIKYGIVLAVALLLHLITMKVADLSCLPVGDAPQDECFISQACSTTQKAYRHFHFYCATMACEVGHADISHVPTDKNFLRPEVCFRKYMLRKSLSSDAAIQIDRHNLSDPRTYYIYGLRKNII